MASIERYRPAREGYQPPSLSQGKPPGAAPPGVPAASQQQLSDRQSHSPTAARRRDVPPAVPSPPTHSSRTSPPRPLPRKGLASPTKATVSPQKAPPPSKPPSTRQQPPLASQWYYTEEELVSTPSVIDGLSPAEERARRAKGVNFIYQSGIAVQPHSLPQMTLYVAAVFFHRFYMRISMVEERGGIHHYKIAATALFLANKTEENCFKTKNLIIAVAKIAQKNIDLIVDEQSKEYWRWRDSILTCEELMLEILTFDLMVANPYDQLWIQLRKLGQLPSKPIREAAWTFLNDAALTAMPLLLDASDLASASIFFASVASGEKIDDVNTEAWWRFLRADEGRITRAIQMMVAFYTENPLKKQNNGRIQGSPVFSLETTRRPHELSQLHGSSSSSQLDGAGRASRDVTPMELDRASQPADPAPPATVDSSGTVDDAAGAHPASRNGNGGGGGGHGSSFASQAESDAPLLSQDVAGDSFSALKAAASRLDHPPRNGRPTHLSSQALQSPDKKRKSADPDDDDDYDYDSTGRLQKRVRQADHAA